VNKINLILIAAVSALFFACAGKTALRPSTEVDISIVPVMNADYKYQYIDLSQNGKVIIDPQFMEARIFRDSLALVKTAGKDGKYGYINKKGEFAISPIYDYAQDFGEGLAWAQEKDKPPTLIDKNGKIILQMDSLIRANPFSNGIAAVTYYNSDGEVRGTFIDKKGMPVLPPIEGMFSPVINEGLYAFQGKDSGKWGFKNEKNETVISERFDSADKYAVYIFFNGLAEVKVDGKWGLIDKKGDFVISPRYDMLAYDSDDLYKVQIGFREGWVNKKGEIVINPQFGIFSLQFYGDSLAPVQIGGLYAYINKKGQIVIEPKFLLALQFFGDYAFVVDDKEKIGIIDRKGNFVIPPMYKSDDDSDIFKEYIYAAIQKRFGFPMRYIYDPSNFKPYAGQKAKK
jgi:hypothetical protein